MTEELLSSTNTMMNVHALSGTKHKAESMFMEELSSGYVRLRTMHDDGELKVHNPQGIAGDQGDQGILGIQGTTATANKLLTIEAWNVDGFGRAVPNLFISCWEWMMGHLHTTLPDVLFLSETKLAGNKLDAKFAAEPWLAENYEWLINSHAKPSDIHGVAMLLRKGRFAYKQLPFTMPNCPSRDSAASNVDGSIGRVLAVCIEDAVCIVGSYCPNSGQSHGKEEAFQVKLRYRVNQWDAELHTGITKLSKTMPTIWMGDLNVAPTDLDLTDAKKSANKACTTVAERASHNDFCEREGLTDVWRAANQRAWWQEIPVSDMTQMSRQSKYGMKLDHILVSASGLERCKHSWVANRTPTSLNHSSDHVLVGMWYELSDRTKPNQDASPFAQILESAATSNLSSPICAAA